MRQLRVLISVCIWLSSPLAATEPRLGWHGEVMPEGLAKADKEGEYLWAKDASLMVFVPAGSFPMGSAAGDPDEKPIHRVTLDAFYIDKYEVSWRQWHLSGLPLPVGIDNRPINEHQPIWGRGDEIPMSYLTWDDTQSYNAWVGKRLPTEAEWEKAARGSDGRAYPWGNQAPSSELVVWKKHPIGKDAPAPVDCCPQGASPYGVENMAGNIFEWCEDYYDAKYYARSPEKNPLQGEERRYRVLRGGSFVHDLEDMRSTLRNRQWNGEGQDYVGFRAVISQSPR